MDMTLVQFVGLLQQIGEVSAIENGEQKEETPLSGDNAFAVSKQLFPRGRSRRLCVNQK